MSTPLSGYLLGLSALVDAGVEFVLVGVGGINFYARDASHAFTTLDLDLLLAPTVENLRAAIRALSERGYVFETGGEPFLDVDETVVLAAVVGQGACLGARHESAGQLDLMLSIRGFSFAEMADDARAFRVGEIVVRVGRLEKLLRSKERSGRPKDIEFLRRFAAEGDEEGDG